MTANTELLPCPFCGEQPVIEYLNGSCLDYGCHDCCMSTDSIQICDLMTIDERLAERELSQKNAYRHEQKFVDRAIAEAKKKWNNRAPAESTAEHGELVNQSQLRKDFESIYSPAHARDYIFNEFASTYYLPDYASNRRHYALQAYCAMWEKYKEIHSDLKS